MNESLLLWGLGLLAMSVLLIVAELFVPSGGLISVLAAGSGIGGIVCLFLYDELWGVLGLAAMGVLVPTAMVVWVKVFPSTRVGRWMILGSSDEQQQAQELAEQRLRDEMLSLLGQEGIAETDLRPVGVVRIHDRRYDALAEGPMIDAGTRVRVTVVDGRQVKVRAVR